MEGEQVKCLPLKYLLRGYRICAALAGIRSTGSTPSHHSRQAKNLSIKLY